MNIIRQIEEVRAEFEKKTGRTAHYLYLSSEEVRKLNHEMEERIARDMVPSGSDDAPMVSSLKLVWDEIGPTPRVSESLQLGPRDLPPIVEGEAGGPYIEGLALAFGMDKASMARLITARDPIKRYAVLLEVKMRGHDHDRGDGYKTATPDQLIQWLDKYRVRLGAAIIAKDADAILSECLNVGNLAWMIAEVAGHLMREDRPIATVKGGPAG